MSTLEPGKLPPLTDAQVQAGARPGESWEQARRRLEAANGACPPTPIDDHPGADYTLAGPFDECEGLDGQPIARLPGEWVPLAVPEGVAGTEPIDDWSGLTVAQVAALAAPGDDWQAGRARAYRLHHCVTPCEPCPVCNHDGAQRWGGWIDVPGYGCGACALDGRSRRKLPHSF